MPNSFWDFFIGQAQAGIEGAKTALDEGNTERNRKWADQSLKSAGDQLNAARSQTERQIADRNNGSYDPEYYGENGAECSKYNPRHPDYEQEDYNPAAMRARHREAVSGESDEYGEYY
jgi:hypothetical protein